MIPRSYAASVRAASTGSPTTRRASSCSWTCAVDASTATLSNSSSSRPAAGHAAATRSLFSVSVPVLSDAITVALPSVSTAVNRRAMAPRDAISRAPSASAMVTVAASPSGTAATATDTPTRNASSSEDPRASMAPPNASVTTTPKPTIRRVKAPTRRCSGVGGGFAVSARPAI